MNNKKGRKPNKHQSEGKGTVTKELEAKPPVEEVKEVVKPPKEFNHTTYLPKSTVVRIITEKLQSGDLKLAQTSQNLILDIAMYFVDMVADQANEICAEAGRATILPDHIVDAIQKMNLMEYLESEADVPQSGKGSRNKRQPKIDFKAQKIRILRQMEAKYEKTKGGIRKQVSRTGDEDGSCDDSIEETPEEREHRRQKEQDALFERYGSITQNQPVIQVQPVYVDPKVPIGGMDVDNYPPFEPQPYVPQDPTMCLADLIEGTVFAQDNEPYQLEAPFWQQFTDPSYNQTIEVPCQEEAMMADLNLMQFAALDLNGDHPMRQMETPEQVFHSTSALPNQQEQNGSSEQASGNKVQPGTNKVKRKKSK